MGGIGKTTLARAIYNKFCNQFETSSFVENVRGEYKALDLMTLQERLIGVPNIQRLNFQGCTRLLELHPSVGGLKQLVQLNLKDCKRLVNLPHELNLESLKILNLSGCSKLRKFPEIVRNMTSLSELYLDGTAIVEIPPSIEPLTGLTLLNLQNCKNLMSIPSAICSLKSLEMLDLSGCKGLQQIEALQCTYLRSPEPVPVKQYIPFKGYPIWEEDANEFTQLEFTFKTEGPGLEVTKCGVHLPFTQDIEDLKQTKPGSSGCTITPFHEDDDLGDSEKDTKIKESYDDEPPHPKWTEHPNLIENWIGNLCIQGQGDSDCE